jgi:glyceraldehyde 3-phosphate dehydrogenase
MRAALGDKNIDFVAVNDLTNAATLAHLLKYDSVLGNLHARIEAKSDTISVDGDEFKVLALRDPAQLPWKALGVDVVFESTGLFTNRDDAAKHLTAGARSGDYRAGQRPRHHARTGVNDEKFTTPRSTRSFPTRRARRTVWRRSQRSFHQRFGIKKGWMTTIHFNTNDQQLLDLPHKDLRRARAAGPR